LQCAGNKTSLKTPDVCAGKPGGTFDMSTGVVVALSVFAVMVLVAVIIAIVSVITTVSGFSNPADDD
jgi:hypothetical protein